MKCDTGKILHWLNGQLSKAEQQALAVHLGECKDCQEEVEQAKKVMQLMEQVGVPEPAVGMELRFEATLRNYKSDAQNEKEIRLGFWGKLYQQLTTKPAFQLGYSFLLLLTGIGIAYFLTMRPANDNTEQELSKLSEEVKDMKQMVMLSLIENPSATERMKAVSYTKEISNADNRVIGALLTTLNEDPNANVRLVALDALVKYSHIPYVREGLIQSISLQESPLLQAALADAMLKLREKKSVEPLQKLLKKNGTGNPAKPKIEKAIAQLSA